MEKTENKDFISSIFEHYNHLPSFKTVAVGIGIGAGRIATAQLCRSSIPWLGTCFPTSNKISPFAITALVSPFFEEAWFRKDLKNPTIPDVLKNAVLFGLMHGLLRGSLEQRVSRVFMSTVGGLFYCVAQLSTGDIWSPAIAHLMYNVSTFFKPMF